jgi:hypothetical protein
MKDEGGRMNQKNLSGFLLPPSSLILPLAGIRRVSPDDL